MEDREISLEKIRLILSRAKNREEAYKKLLEVDITPEDAAKIISNVYDGPPDSTKIVKLLH